MAAGVPLSELLTWEPEDLATLVEWLEERADAAKDAARAGKGGGPGG